MALRNPRNFILAALSMAACDAEEPANVCEEAMAVVLECTGEELATPLECGDSAAQSAAEAIVAGGCDAIDGARDGKSDDADTICAPELDLPFCDPEAFSRIGEAALRAMRNFPDDEFSVWNYGANATLETDWIIQTPPAEHWGRPVSELVVAGQCSKDNAVCNTDFELYRCETQSDCTHGGICKPVSATVTRPGQQAEMLCVGHSEVLYETFYDALVQAEERIDFTTLSEPDGRFEAAIRNAMTYLAAVGEPLEISFLFGMRANANVFTERFMGSVLRDVPDDAPMKVWVGAYSAGQTSWNHSKIVAIDDKLLVQGGHNNYTDSYLTSSPTHDISMQVSGGPVMDAHRYAMELWRPICERPTNYALTEVVMYPSNLGNCPPAYDTAESDEEDGGIRYISAGRLGKLGADPTDDALVAMLDAAQDSIRLSLQDLGPLKFLIFNLGKWPEPVMGALARAAARGVDVYIVLSTNRSGKFDDYGNGWKPEDAVKNVGKWLEDRPDEVPAGQRVRDIICDKLHVTTLRPSTDDVWPDGRHFGNHAKFVVVDDEAFYMGSQNLYDANLAEYGLIIDDPDVTDEVLSQYWFPMWEQSKRVAVSGSGAPSCSY